MDKKQRAYSALNRLKKTYKAPGPFVSWKTPLELLVGTVLSAQCTDARVNQVTKKLFKKYTTARAYASADLKTLEGEIYQTGFYRAKARYLKEIGRVLDEQFGGTVPGRLEDLLTLPGVSFKTAHLIMAKAFGSHTGVAVDTHVKRVAPRLGLTKHHDPNKIAGDLEKLYPVKDYLDVNEYLITHGRAVCKPKPLCGKCVLNDICPTGKKILKDSKTSVKKPR